MESSMYIITMKVRHTRKDGKKVTRTLEQREVPFNAAGMEKMEKVFDILDGDK